MKMTKFVNTLTVRWIAMIAIALTMSIAAVNINKAHAQDRDSYDLMKEVNALVEMRIASLEREMKMVMEQMEMKMKDLREEMAMMMEIQARGFGRMPETEK